MASIDAFSPGNLVEVPNIAWPTIILLFMCAVVHCATLWCIAFELISPWVGLIINTFADYVVFTPMHDAAHGSVAKHKYGILNNIVGNVAATLFGLPFAAFKHLHLMHHKYTNEDRDPDLWAGIGPWYILPLKWATTEMHYYSIYLWNVRGRPLKEAVPSLSIIAFVLWATIFSSSTSYGVVFIYGWILPGRLAIMMLAYFFDYLPHRPHDISRKENPFLATSVTTLYLTQSWFLTWPLLHQNYHNIHHLAPFIPFYMYSTVWHAKKDFCLAQGTSMRPIFGAPPCKSN